MIRIFASFKQMQRVLWKHLLKKFRNSYHLSENDTQILLSYMEEIRFKKKEVIVHEGSKTEICI